MNSSLILFDIDGTLTYHVGPRRWEEQYWYGLRIAYGIDVHTDFSRYNGNVERQMAWDVLRSHGVSEDEFLMHYPAYIQAMYDHLVEWEKKGQVFVPIEDARSLVRKLLQYPEQYSLGVLTGNAKRIAQWKLVHAGYADMFSFGLFGDDATDRIELAKRVFRESAVLFRREFSPDDVVIIGDTVHDIRCGKAIGARTIAVTTGMHGDRNVLEAELPTCVVDSLLDPVVFEVLR